MVPRPPVGSGEPGVAGPGLGHWGRTESDIRFGGQTPRRRSPWQLSGKPTFAGLIRCDALYEIWQPDTGGAGKVTIIAQLLVAITRSAISGGLRGGQRTSP